MNGTGFRNDPKHPRCVGSVAYGADPGRPRPG